MIPRPSVSLTEAGTAELLRGLHRARAAGAATGDTARVRDEVVRRHLPLVRHLALRFRDRGESLDDLLQVATIGLLQAVDRYDPGRGAEFSTFATPTIVGEIKRHFRDRGWAVRMPRRLQEAALAVSSAAAELTQRLSRSPTVDELAAATGLGPEEVLDALESAHAYSTVPLDVELAEKPRFADIDAALEGVESREALRRALDRLPARDRQIVVLRFFAGMSQSRIATEVGVSQMHVSRLLARALAVLRTELGDG